MRPILLLSTILFETNHEEWITHGAITIRRLSLVVLFQAVSFQDIRVMHHPKRPEKNARSCAPCVTHKERRQSLTSRLARGLISEVTLIEVPGRQKTTHKPPHPFEVWILQSHATCLFVSHSGKEADERLDKAPSKQWNGCVIKFIKPNLKSLSR